MTTWITICDTCKREGWDAERRSTTDGADLAALIEAAAQGRAGVTTRRHSCLMGCQHGCNVAIQADGKLTYVLGRFTADPEAEWEAYLPVSPALAVRKRNNHEFNEYKGSGNPAFAQIFPFKSEDIKEMITEESKRVEKMLPRSQHKYYSIIDF